MDETEKEPIAVRVVSLPDTSSLSIRNKLIVAGLTTAVATAGTIFGEWMNKKMRKRDVDELRSEIEKLKKDKNAE